MVQNYEEIGVLEGGIFVKKEGKNSELKYLKFTINANRKNYM